MGLDGFNFSYLVSVLYIASIKLGNVLIWLVASLVI